MLIMTMRERLNEKNNNARDEYFLQLPSGYRFVPTDEELIVHYLRKKELGQELPRNRIHQAQVYQLRPDQLAEAYPLVRGTAWYFFTSRQRKYANGSRPSRSVEGGGFWKPTGIPRPILAGCDQTCIGFRRALDFYADRKDPCSKTDWKMLEYILPPPPTLTPTTGHPSSISRPAPPLPQGMRLEGWALCKVYRAAGRNKKRKYENEEEEDVDATTYHEDETDEKKDVDPSDSGVMAISYHHHEEDDGLYQLVPHVLDDGPNSDRLDVRY